MKATHAVAIAVLSAQLAGCSWVQSMWPFGPEEGVPVTRPTVEDANVPEPVPTPARPTQVARPAAPEPNVPAGPPTIPDGPLPLEQITIVPPRPTAAPPASAGQPSRQAAIDRPTNLTDLLYGPKPDPTPPAPTTRPTVPPTATTPPPPTVAVGPPHTGGKPPRGPGESIGRTILPVGPPPKPTGPEHLVAASGIQVNRRFITVDDILRRLRPRIIKLPDTLSVDAFLDRVQPWVLEEIQSQTIQSMVLEEAYKRMTDQQKQVVDAEVQEALNSMMASVGGSKTRLRRELEQSGTSLEQQMTDFREDAAYRFYLRSRFMPSIIITRKMLLDYYQRNRDQFTSEKKVQMQIVAAPFKRFLPENVASPSDAELQVARTQARETIDRAAEAVAKGEPFADVAKRLSRGLKASSGGLWPMMAADTFRETKVEQAAFKLQEGQTAGPIETETGFYLVKASRIEAGKTVGFVEAQEQIHQTLRDQKYLELTQEYFQNLHEKATIIRSDGFVEHVLGKAVQERFPQ